jgi:prevent-host-death family protein
VKTLTASELEARCLAVLDEAGRTGEVFVITRNGREIARLVGSRASVHPQDDLRGTVTLRGDVVAPATRPEDWAAADGTPPQPDREP